MPFNTKTQYVYVNQPIIKIMNDELRFSLVGMYATLQLRTQSCYDLDILAAYHWPNNRYLCCVD